MQNIMGILFFLSLLSLIAGLVKPGLVLRWKQDASRGQVSLYFGLATLFFFVMIGVTGKSTEPTKKEKVNEQSAKQTLQNQREAQLSADFLGNYHGIQPGYFLKNQYGDDMVINGNKVPVPSIDFKFLLKENGIVSLQQTNLEDNSRVYYDGTIKITNDATNVIQLECSLSDGQSSNPTYTLAINKADKTANCIGHNEPEFRLEKIK